ncbi:MAG TPA: MoxR family ATPase [Polyangiaceae bacterium]|nr:MoxR family ATPase [Polyangiaceae bacterium]
MSQALQTSELSLLAERVHQLRDQVSRVYIGDRAVVDLLLIALLARGHCLLEGVPGVAKTTLVKTFAKSLGCSVRRIQFTPDLLPADITGTHVLNPRDATFQFRPGPIFANVLLADEINRAPAKTQSALLEAMQERQVTVEGDRFELPNPFLVLATQNPIDLEGTYPLPESQIDRFLVCVRIGYPAQKDEVTMLRTHGVTTPEVQPLVSAEQALQLQALVDQVHVEEDLMDYCVRLTAFTRSHPHVTLGASPRASLGLLRAAKAHAAIASRGYLVPDDVQAMAPAVLEHRLILVPELEDDSSVRPRVVSEALSRVSYQRGMRGR